MSLYEWQEDTLEEERWHVRVGEDIVTKGGGDNKKGSCYREERKNDSRYVRISEMVGTREAQTVPYVPLIK